MLNKFKDAAANVISKTSYKENEKEGEVKKPEKYCYARPYFLDLDSDEIKCAQDSVLRPVIKPRNMEGLPLTAGYAECINGGKSQYNEDNCYACVLRIRSKPSDKVDIASYNKLTCEPPETGNTLRNGIFERSMLEIKYQKEDLNAVYFGLFDGHAGHQTSLIVSRILHQIVQDKLQLCLEHIHQKSDTSVTSVFDPTCDISIDDLVIGALEEAFKDMDDRLEREGRRYYVKGGCTALVVLMFEGKIYIANAGDSRAVLCYGNEVKQMTNDFNPLYEKHRINLLGYEHPELLHDEFTCMEFTRRLNKTDVGKVVLCRKPGRVGWSYKKVEEDDIKFPIINGFGKKARVMATIGVTRGLGDHDLYVYDSKIWIKPFLSCKPEVQVIDAKGINDWTDEDVLVVGTDGLWDVLKNKEVGEIVHKEFLQSDKLSDKKCVRYTIVAQELVTQARGQFTDRGWKKSDGDAASFDDISVFVIPVLTYLNQWKSKELSTWGVTS